YSFHTACNRTYEVPKSTIKKSISKGKISEMDLHHFLCMCYHFFGNRTYYRVRTKRTKKTHGRNPYPWYLLLGSVYCHPFSRRNNCRIYKPKRNYISNSKWNQRQALKSLKTQQCIPKTG